MIHRAASNVTHWTNYADGPPERLLIPGGTYSSGGVSYLKDAPYLLSERVTGLKVMIGTITLHTATFGQGEYLFVRESDTRVQVYKVVGGVPARQDDLVRTVGVTGVTDPPPFTLTVKANTALGYVLTSSSTTITVQNLPSGWKFTDRIPDAGGTVQYDQLQPVDNGTKTVKTNTGAIVESFTWPTLPGDTLMYVAPDNYPAPTGAGYKHTMSPTLQAHYETLDGAFVAGGLLRQTPALTALVYPNSDGWLHMGSTTYRLNDGQAVLDLKHDLWANRTQVKHVLTVDTQVRELIVGGDFHAYGMPGGFALAGTLRGAEGLALERNEYGEVFFYWTTFDQAPTCLTRSNVGAWDSQPMAYMVPAAQGTLTDRRMQVRRSGGPYLVAGYLERHAVPLILAGNADINEPFVGLLVGGRVRTYSSVGGTAFHNRLHLLIRGD